MSTLIYLFIILAWLFIGVLYSLSKKKIPVAILWLAIVTITLEQLFNMGVIK